MVMPHDPLALVSSVAGDVASAIAVAGVTIGAAITKTLWARVTKLEDRNQANIEAMANAGHAHAAASTQMAAAHASAVTQIVAAMHELAEEVRRARVA